MVQRIALLVGGLGAIAVLAVALGFGGFASADPATDVNAANLAADIAPSADAGAQAQPPQAAQQPKVVTRTVKDKVYVLPTPKPKVVRIDNGPAQQPSANHTKKSNTSAKPSRNTNAEPGDDGGYEADHERGERGDGGERSGGERGGDD